MPTSSNSVDDLVDRIARVMPACEGSDLAGFAADVFFYLDARPEIASVEVEQLSGSTWLIAGVMVASGGREGLRPAARAVQQVFQADLAYHDFSACSVRITDDDATLTFVTTGSSRYFVAGRLVVVPS